MGWETRYALVLSYPLLGELCCNIPGDQILISERRLKVSVDLWPCLYNLKSNASSELAYAQDGGNYLPFQVFAGELLPPLYFKLSGGCRYIVWGIYWVVYDCIWACWLCASGP